MNGSLERRLAALEAKAKAPRIATWVDLMLWLDDPRVEGSLCPELQMLVQEMLSESDR